MTHATLVVSSTLVAFAAPAHADGTLPCGASAVEGGDSHTLAIGPGGTVYAWGNNYSGQLGDGSTTDRSTPGQVAGLTGVVAVAAGDDHSLAVTASGLVYSWGKGEYAQLGYHVTGAQTTPRQVPGLTGITDVVAGRYFSLAVGAGGVVYAWGDNFYGQLGLGSTTTVHEPTRIPGLTGVVDIAVSHRHTIVATASGAAYAWGENSDGELGDGTTTNRSSPVQVTGLTGVTRVAAGGNFSFAVAGSGTLYSWGNGALGDPNAFQRTTPGTVPGMTSVTAIASAPTYAIAVQGGAAYAWGSDPYGNLGFGTYLGNYSSPTPVTATGVVSGVAVGQWHSAVVGAAGTVHTFGYNFYGQLGDGTTTNRSAPVHVTDCPMAPTATSAADSPDPVLAGAAVTFSVGWTDDNKSDQVRAVVCRTNAVSGGFCTGGTWARGALTSSKPATSSYTTSQADVGTKAYYAFACDTTNLCSPSISGTFTVNSAAPTASSASATPNPVVAGGTVTFSVSWSDPNAGQQVRAVVCKTNALNGSNCSGDTWAYGALSTANPASTSYVTSSADVGSHSYYAFACDATDLCSAARSGTFAVNSAAPVATSASDTPEPIAAGNPLTFSVAWTDPNPGERARAVVCKTNALSGAACAGGTWATGSLTSSSTATASYLTTTADIGSRAYYAFVCDATGLCSSAISGTFTVVPPPCSDGVDNDGDGKTDHPADPGCANAGDQTEGPSCPPVAAGAVVCLDPGAHHSSYEIGDASLTPDGSGVRIAGWINRYRFSVADVTVTVSCVDLVVDGTTPRPCRDAGGVFVERVATLVDTTVRVGTLGTVNICKAELTVTVTGNGVDSAPAFARC